MIIERQDIFGFKEFNGVNKHIIYEEPLRRNNFIYKYIFVFIEKYPVISLLIFMKYFLMKTHIIIHCDLWPTPNYWN